MKPPIFKFAKPDKINAKNGNFEKIDSAQTEAQKKIRESKLEEGNKQS